MGIMTTSASKSHSYPSPPTSVVNAGLRSSAQWTMVNSLFLATVVRVLLVIISYGAKVPAGIFVPSMAVGAYFGRLVGIIVKAIYK